MKAEGGRLDTDACGYVVANVAQRRRLALQDCPRAGAVFFLLPPSYFLLRREAR